MKSRTRCWTARVALSTVVIGSATLSGCDPASEQGFTPHPSKPVSIGEEDNPTLQREGNSPQDTRSSAETEIKVPRIVALGNSLTAGRGVSPDESYPAQLQKRLNEAGYCYRVINAGVSGDTTAGGLRRLSWVLRSRPNMVILELGANDGLRGLLLEQTRSNLEQIIKRLLAEGVTVVLAGMKLPPNYGPEYTGRFYKMYGELAKQYNLTLMPFFLEGVATQAELNQADGIHPTGEGYGIIVNNLLPVLEPLLKTAAQTPA